MNATSCRYFLLFFVFTGFFFYFQKWGLSLKARYPVHNRPCHSSVPVGITTQMTDPIEQPQLSTLAGIQAVKMYAFQSDLQTGGISCHQFNVRAEHSQPWWEGWEPQRELCKWQNDRACSNVQPCKYDFSAMWVRKSMSPSRRCQATEGTGMFGFVLWKAPSDATCWNAIFVVSTHK